MSLVYTRSTPKATAHRFEDAMPFMLLGKGPDDDIRLLRSTLWATRKEALDEVARLTADTGFADWDTEVFVIDLDQAMPVLLVRPAVNAAPAEETEADEPADSDGDADLKAVLTKLSQDETEVTPEGAVWPESAEPIPIETVDAAWAEAVMSAEGAPGTTGTASDDGPADDRTVVGVQTPASVRGPLPADEVAPAAVDEPSGEGDLPAPVESEAAGAFRIASWPWSKQASEVEEPAIIIDLDEPEEVDDPKKSQFEQPEAVKEPVSVAEPQPVADATANESEADAESDFIDLEALVQDIEPAPEPPGYRAGDAGAPANMACTDCVYVETCPHAGERDPSSCGSFQWK